MDLSLSPRTAARKVVDLLDDKISFPDALQVDVDQFIQIVDENLAKRKRFPLKSVLRASKDCVELRIQASDAFDDQLVRFKLTFNDVSEYPTETGAKLSLLSADDDIKGKGKRPSKRNAGYPEAIVAIVKPLNRRLARGNGRAKVASVLRSLLESLFVEGYESWFPKTTAVDNEEDGEAEGDVADMDSESDVGSDDDSLRNSGIKSSNEGEGSQRDAGWDIDVGDGGVPAEIKAMLEQDVKEVRDVDGYFVSVHPDDSLGLINVRLALSVGLRLGINTEQALAWGMNRNECIVLSMRFPAWFVKSSARPSGEDVKLFQSDVHSDKDIDLGTTAVSKGKSFGLAWLVRDRLINGLLSEWPPAMVPRAEEELSKNKDKDNEDDSEDDVTLRFMVAPGVSELMDMFPHLTPLVAYWALQKFSEDSNNRMMKAAELLMDPSSAQVLELEVHENLDTLMRDGPQSSKPAARRRHGVHPLSGLAPKNFLLRILEYIETTIATCTITCMICNKMLEYAGLKPVVCNSRLCLYKYEELGLGVDLAAEIRNDTHVVDLLISFAAAAAGHDRIDLCYPENVSIVDRSSGEELSFMTAGKPNLQLLQRIISLLPPMDVMMTCPNTTALKALLDNQHPLCYPLLRWIVTSNRSHLRKLNPSEKIQGVPTEHQYMLLTQPPEREAAFRKQKERYGSFYMFHGSPLSNWHSILRSGLQIKGKGLGVSGAAIWMANDFSTSWGYSQKGGAQHGWKCSSFGSLMYCMAILEVVNDPAKKAQKGASVNVISDTSIIMTRYFLVFPGSMPQAQCQASSIKVRDVFL
jgi:hypothetical protein